MLIRPDRGDVATILRLVGLTLVGLGLVMLVPAAAALAWREVDEAAEFAIGACLPLLAGSLAAWRIDADREVRWNHAMVATGTIWLAAPFCAAVPLYLSGHYARFLDAYFDAMSGFATAGLAVINDLDHLSRSMNLWRHLMQFMGGQGLVLIMLSLFAARTGATGMYAGEAREDKIMPNVRRTARFIWQVALAWLVLGTAVLWAALMVAGMPVGEGLFHAVNLFMAAFDTGGFAPTSASVALYHSALVEGVLAVFMVAGALSFALHARVWRGRLYELRRNVEIRFLVGSLIVTMIVVALGLVRANTIVDTVPLFRRGWFQVLSAHTGTGFNSVPGRFFWTDWGTLAPAALVVAMAFGGMAGSTAGGIKAIRLAVTIKDVRQRIRLAILPSDAVTVESFHSGGRQVVTPTMFRSALLVLLLYLVTYFAGALVGLFYGYPIEQALFESTSAAAAVGLSIGLTAPGMETGLEVTYILLMWLGRLEFIACLSLLGFVWAAVRGRL